VKLSPDGGVFILAFDHRSSFRAKFFNTDGESTPEQTAIIADAKGLAFEGVRRAVADGLPKASAGLLVDEQYGAAVARAAKAEGLLLVMPVEKTGRAEFEFEYGDDFGAHIEEFDPAYTKALVRYNPEGDAAVNERQAARLRALSDWLRERGRRLMFELLVPPEPSQLARVGTDTARYDHDVRPGLMEKAVVELQEQGVEPHVWKIEGLDRREDCETIAVAARRGGRDDVGCVVLGRGADNAAVDRWLRAASRVPGYIGFAIGRSIWWEPVGEYLAGRCSRSDAAAAIGSNYRRFVDVYAAGAG
jgi:myo-inositol catabolism protein IolC